MMSVFPRFPDKSIKCSVPSRCECDLCVFSLGYEGLTALSAEVTKGTDGSRWNSFCSQLVLYLE
jgi:hypothetical protein